MRELDKKLLEDNINLSYSFFKKHNIKDKDLKQYIYTYVCENSCYNKNIGAYSTYLFMLMDTAEKRHYYNLNVQKRALDKHGDLVLSLDYKSDGEHEFKEIVPCKRNDLELRLLEISANQEFKRLLTTKEKYVINSILQGQTFEKIGKELNCSKQNISLIYNKIKEKLDGKLS